MFCLACINNISYLKCVFVCVVLICVLSLAVFDFHQVVDGLQESERQAQEGKK